MRRIYFMYPPSLALALDCGKEEDKEDNNQNQEYDQNWVYKVISGYVASALIAKSWTLRVKAHPRRRDDSSSDSASVLGNGGQQWQ